MPQKKFKLVYEIEFTGNGHGLLTDGIEEVMKHFTDVIATELVMPEEKIIVRIKKKTLDKE